MKWKMLDRQSAYDGFFKVDLCHVKYDKYQGGELEVKRELFHRGDAVAVLLYDPVNDKLVMIEQFRIGAIDDEQGPWMLEIVAGIVEEGESPQDVARRECKEEAGINIHSFENIYSFYASPGGSSEKIYLLCGLLDSNDIGGYHGLDHEGEDIKVVVMDYQEAVDLLHANEIAAAIPLIALQWLQLNRERLKIESFVL